MVVDRSFWCRTEREEYKRLIEGAGGRWKLTYLKVDSAVLGRRLTERAGRFDANAAFPITDDLLARYLLDFEAPCGEGEEVVTVTS